MAFYLLEGKLSDLARQAMAMGHMVELPEDREIHGRPWLCLLKGI